MNNTFQKCVYARKEAWGESIEIAYNEINFEGRQRFVGEMTMREIPEGADLKPLLKLSPTMAQHLMDELWQCGVRPTEGTGSAGQMAAVKEHLQDMRKIAFGMLDGVPSFMPQGSLEAKGPKV